MRKVLYFIFAAAVVMFSAGCSDTYTINNSLTASSTAHFLTSSDILFSNVSPDAFSKSFTVTSYNTSWTFDQTPDWIELTPSSGNSTSGVVLNCEENGQAYYSRSALLYLSSTDADWEYKQSICVNQGAAVPSIDVAKNELEINGAGGVYSVEVTANFTWLNDCQSEWIELYHSEDGRSLVIVASPNPESSYRTANIWVGSNESPAVSKYISVKQAPAGVSASALSLEYGNMAGKYDVQVNAEAPWEAITSDNWISVSPSNGSAGETTIGIEVAPNGSVSKRTGYVALSTDGNKKLQIEISQSGNYIETEGDGRVSFRAIAGPTEFGIRSNTSWQVIGKPSWVSVSPESGTGDAVFTISAEDNASLSGRTGDIRIGHPGMALECKVHVSQDGMSLEAGKTYLQFSDKGGTQSFELTADAFWTSRHSDDWFASTPTSGNGDATISVTAEENKTADQRNGLITYDWIGNPVYVSLIQQSKYLTIDNSTFDFPSKGGTHIIDLMTNDQWTATDENNVSWLHLSQTSGTGDAKITITADDNATVSARSTTVVINTVNSQTVRITVTQQPRFLTLSASNVLFFSAGGTSGPVSIQTDGSVSISQEGSWFTVNRDGDSFTVTAPKNEDHEARTGTITVALADLSTGSYAITIPVTQLGRDESFYVEGYSEDKNWDADHALGQFSIKVTGYSTDRNWDNTYSQMKVTITGYSTDEDWNNK